MGFFPTAPPTARAAGALHYLRRLGLRIGTTEPMGILSKASHTLT